MYIEISVCLLTCRIIMANVGSLEHCCRFLLQHFNSAGLNASWQLLSCVLWCPYSVWCFVLWLVKLLGFELGFVGVSDIRVVSSNKKFCVCRIFMHLQVFPGSFSLHWIKCFRRVLSTQIPQSE